MNADDDMCIGSKNEEMIKIETPIVKKKKYLNVLDEIIETEEAYLSDVEKIINGYLKKIESSLYSEICLTIFGNLEEIFIFHQKLLPQIKNEINDQDKFSSIFITMKDQFVNIYGNYCTNYVKATEELSERLKSKEFSDFISAIQIELNHKLPLSTFLLKPVQRILKYQLLLKSLGDSLEKESLPFKITKKSAEIMGNVAVRINEIKKETENNNRFLFYKERIVNLDNFELKSSGKYIEEYYMIIKEEKQKILTFERYVIILKEEEDHTFSALYSLPLRQVDIHVDKKKLKQIEFELDDRKIILRAKDEKEAQKFISTVIKMKKYILEILKAGNPKEIDKITSAKIEIAKNKKSNIDPNLYTTQLSSKFDPVNIDLLENKIDELNSLKNKSFTQTAKHYLGTSISIDSISKDSTNTTNYSSQSQSVSEDSFNLSYANIVKKYAPVPVKEIINPIVDSFLYVKDSPCQEIQYIIDKNLNLIENEKGDTSITEKGGTKVTHNKNISMKTDIVKKNFTNLSKAKDQDNIKPLASMISKLPEHEPSVEKSEKTTKVSLSDKLNMINLNINKIQAPLVSNIIDIENKRTGIPVQYSVETINDDSSNIYDSFNDIVHASLVYEENITSDIFNAKEIDNNLNRAENDNMRDINYFKTKNKFSDKRDQIAIDKSAIQDDLNQLDDIEKIYESQINFGDEFDENNNDIDKNNNDIDKNHCDSIESLVEDRYLNKDFNHEKIYKEDKMVKYKPKTFKKCKNETLKEINNNDKRGEYIFIDLNKSIDISTKKKIGIEHNNQEINNKVEKIVESEIYRTKNDQNHNLNINEKSKNISESNQKVQVDDFDKKKISNVIKNNMIDIETDISKNNSKIEQKPAKINIEGPVKKNSQSIVNLISSKFEQNFTISALQERKNSLINKEIEKNDTAIDNSKSKKLPDAPNKRKLPQIPNKK